jgi:hypothetical protein
MVTAGEDIRWIPRRRVSAVAIPGNDFSLFDDNLIVFPHYAGNGTATEKATSTDPDTIQLCRTGMKRVAPSRALRSSSARRTTTQT